MQQAQNREMQHTASSWHPPEHPLALEQVLQSQQALLPLRPVGAGAVVQHLGHVLRLTQVVRCHAAVAWAVRALGASTGGVAVGVVVRVHSRWLEAPPHRPPLNGRREDVGVYKQNWKVTAACSLYLPLDLDLQDHAATETCRFLMMWDRQGYFMLVGLSSPLTSGLML